METPPRRPVPDDICSARSLGSRRMEWADRLPATADVPAWRAGSRQKVRRLVQVCGGAPRGNASSGRSLPELSAREALDIGNRRNWAGVLGTRGPRPACAGADARADLRSPIDHGQNERIPLTVTRSASSVSVAVNPNVCVARVASTTNGRLNW